jgi:DNA-binding transcriptional MerR regulator
MCPSAGGCSDGSSWTATDVDYTVCIRYRGQVGGEARDGASGDNHGESGQKSGHPHEARVVGVMVNRGHRTSLRLQADLKSNDGMDLIPIGEAADRLGLNPSALRYYDERGLVSPAGRQAGRRMYGPDELRRLAFIKIAQRLGLPLDTAAAVLDAPGLQWRELVRQQLAQLDQVITQAQGAQLFLSHALNCPTNHPARECSTMIATLDRLVEGATVDQLVAEHT